VVCASAMQPISPAGNDRGAPLLHAGARGAGAWRRAPERRGTWHALPPLHPNPEKSRHSGTQKCVPPWHALCHACDQTVDRPAPGSVTESPGTGALMLAPGEGRPPGRTNNLLVPRPRDFTPQWLSFLAGAWGGILSASAARRKEET